MPVFSLFGMTRACLSWWLTCWLVGQSNLVGITSEIVEYYSLISSLVSPRERSKGYVRVISLGIEIVGPTNILCLDGIFSLLCFLFSA